jgi:holin-like protein
MLRGILVLLLFQCLGELVKIATGTVLPGAVIGLLLLLAALMAYRGVPAWLDQSSQHMLALLPLLLMPPSVGLIFLGPRLQGQWPAIAGAVVLGTILTLLFSAALLQWLVKSGDRRRAP